jgi:biotin carboxyl carrier protein
MTGLDPTVRPIRVTVDGADAVVVSELASGAARDAAGGTDIATPLPTSAADRADGIRRFEVVVDGWRFEVTAEPAARAELRERASRTRAKGTHTREQVRARIPGRVVRIWVAPGDPVEVGQRLLAVEAMKMENEIRASHAGTVESIPVVVGETVELGQELVVVG